MERDNDRIKSFTRRAVLVGAIQGGLMAGLVSRLAWLQVAQGQKYRMLAENNRINIKLIPPVRGLILDRYGRKIASNDQNFRVILIPEQTDDIDAALGNLRRYIDLTDHDIDKALKAVDKQASFMPVEVKSNLNWDEVSVIDVNLTDLPGIAIDEGQVRNYPFADTMAHITGYVGAVNKSDLVDNAGNPLDDPVLSLPGFKIGKVGIEKSFEKELRGRAGTAEIEVNVVGREVRELNRYNGTPGAKVWLTIDAELQTYAHQRLSEEKSASVVVMDVKTGAIYALASYPSYDPNVFSRGIPADLWEQLNSDPVHPLINKAVSGLYPPGSTFKVATALALLESGTINRNTTQYCPGYYDFGDARFHCWKHNGHGTLSVVDAIEQSCDVFFYKCGVELGIDALAGYAMRLGLGSHTGIEMDEDRAGLMPTKAWKKTRYDESWQQGETIVAAIGQGYTLATPLQLALMTARLVSNSAIKPSIAGYVGDQPRIPAVWPSLGFKQENIDIVLEGMNSVCNSQRGTCWEARITDPTLAMGGKTGSAQVKRITKLERAENMKNDELPWDLRDQALFISYAPVDNPRYACAVVVEHGMHGGSAAAPIARDLLLAAQKRDPAANPIKPA
jgi:penicillin-binding protein 2